MRTTTPASPTRARLAAAMALAAGTAAASMLPAAPAHADAAAPNILLIMLDDVGAESFESYFGNPINTADGQRIDTPNITALANTGMRFTNAYATPMCTPSRVQMMTGRYNYANYRSFWYLDNTETTFAQVLRDGGYTTGVHSKWQLSDTSDWASRHDAGYGQDVGVAPTGVTAEGGHVSPTVMREDYGFDDYLINHLNEGFGGTAYTRYWNPVIETPSADGTQSVVVPTTINDYGPDLFVDHAKDFISNAVANDQPFFSYFAAGIPHDPWLPTPDQNPTNAQKTENDRGFSFSDPLLGVGDPANFDENVEYADKMVGQLIDHLDDPNGDGNTADSVRDNTVIIFTTDNGLHKVLTVQNDSHTVPGGKNQPTHAGTHAPFIINWQGTVAAGTSDRVIDLTDVFPTLMEVAGVQAPTGLTLDGKTIIDADGNVQDNRDVAYGYYRPLWSSAVPDGFTSEYAIEKQYKLYDDGRMFDILNDPAETTDLSLGTLDATQQAAHDTLQAELDKQTAQRLIAPKFLNGFTRQVSDTNLDGIGDTRANTVLIVGDNATDNQAYRTVAEFDLTHPDVADLIANFGSATLVTQVTLTKGTVPDIRVVAMTADENGDVQTGSSSSAANDFQAGGVEVAVLTGLTEGDIISLDVTDTVLADLGQSFTSFRFEAVDPDLNLIAGAQQIRLGGVLGEGVGIETATRLILGALGDLDIDGHIDADAYAHGDFNGDGVIDALDLDLIRINWGFGLTASASFEASVAAAFDIPEPGTTAIFAALGALLMRRPKR